jgi:hypothetical protein
MNVQPGPGTSRTSAAFSVQNEPLLPRRWRFAVVVADADAGTGTGTGTVRRLKRELRCRRSVVARSLSHSVGGVVHACSRFRAFAKCARLRQVHRNRSQSCIRDLSTYSKPRPRPCLCCFFLSNNNNNSSLLASPLNHQYSTTRNQHQIKPQVKCYSILPATPPPRPCCARAPPRSLLGCLRPGHALLVTRYQNAELSIGEVISLMP